MYEPGLFDLQGVLRVYIECPIVQSSNPCIDKSLKFFDRIRDIKIARNMNSRTNTITKIEGDVRLSLESIYGSTDGLPAGGRVDSEGVDRLVNFFLEKGKAQDIANMVDFAYEMERQTKQKDPFECLVYYAIALSLMKVLQEMSAVPSFDTIAARENYKNLTNSINTIFLKAPKEIQRFIFEYSLEHHTDYFEVDHLYLLLSGIVRRWREFPEIEGLDEKLRSLGVDIVNHGRLKRGSDQPTFGSWNSISSQILVDLDKLEILDANMDELIALNDIELMGAQIDRIISKHNDVNKDGSRVIDPAVSEFFNSLNDRFEHYQELGLDMDYFMSHGLFKMVIALFNKLANYGYGNGSGGWRRGIFDLAYEKVWVPLEEMINLGGLGSNESVREVLKLIAVSIKCSGIVFEGRNVSLLRRLVAYIGSLDEVGREQLMRSREMEEVLLSHAVQAESTRRQLVGIWGEEVMNGLLLGRLNENFQQLKRSAPTEAAFLGIIPDIYAVFGSGVMLFELNEDVLQIGGEDDSLQRSLSIIMSNSGVGWDSLRRWILDCIDKLKHLPDFGQERYKVLDILKGIIEEKERQEELENQPFVDEQGRYFDQFVDKLARYKEQAAKAHDYNAEEYDRLKTDIIEHAERYTQLYIANDGVRNRVLGVINRILNDGEGVVKEEAIILVNDLGTSSAQTYYVQWLWQRIVGRIDTETENLVKRQEYEITEGAETIFRERLKSLYGRLRSDLDKYESIVKDIGDLYKRYMPTVSYDSAENVAAYKAHLIARFTNEIGVDIVKKDIRERVVAAFGRLVEEGGEAGGDAYFSPADMRIVEQGPYLSRVELLGKAIQGKTDSEVEKYGDDFYKAVGETRPEWQKYSRLRSLREKIGGKISSGYWDQFMKKLDGKFSDVLGNYLLVCIKDEAIRMRLQYQIGSVWRDRPNNVYWEEDNPIIDLDGEGIFADGMSKDIYLERLEKICRYFETVLGAESYMRFDFNGTIEDVVN